MTTNNHDDIDNLLDETADELLIASSSSKITFDDQVDLSLSDLQESEEHLRAELIALSHKKGIDVSELLHGLNHPDETNPDSHEVDEDEIARVNTDIMKVLQQLLSNQHEGDPQEVVKNLLQRLCSQEGIEISDAFGDFDSETGMEAKVDEPPPPLVSERSFRNVLEEDCGVCSTERDQSESLHQAVFMNSYGTVSELLEKNPMSYYDVKDRRGNTPLMLAVKLRDVDMAVALINSGAECDVTSGQTSMHLIDEAALSKDRRLVRMVYSKLQEKIWNHWLERRPKLLGVLAGIPDFFVEMDWKFHSSSLLGPLVKAMAPHDTYRIWKRGNWLRIDSSIVGFSKPFTVKRGNMSLILTGTGSDMPGDLLVVDRVKKTVARVFRRLESPTMKELDLMAQKLIAAAGTKHGKELVDLGVKNFSFSPSLDREGHVRREQPEGWPSVCELWSAEADVKVVSENKESLDVAIDLSCGRDVAAAAYFQGRSATHSPQPSPASSDPDSYLEPRSAIEAERMEEARALRAQSSGSPSSMTGVRSPLPTALHLHPQSHPQSPSTWHRPTCFDHSTGAFTDTPVPVPSATSVEDTPVLSLPEHTKRRSTAPRIMLDRHVKASLWMQPDAPFQLKDLLPALEVLAMKDKTVKKLNGVLDSVLRDVPERHFPVRLKVPLFLGVNAVVQFGKVDVEDPSDVGPHDGSEGAFCALFEIPPEYIHIDAP